MLTTTSSNSIPNDGHCLFRSISVARLGNNLDIAVLNERNSIKSFLDRHEEVRGWYYSSGDARRYRDMCLMKGNVVWGSFTDIMLLSHLRNIEIRLITINNNSIASSVNVRGISNPNTFNIPTRFGITSNNYITIYTNSNGNHFSAFPNDPFLGSTQPSSTSTIFNTNPPPPPPPKPICYSSSLVNNSILQPATYSFSSCNINNSSSAQSQKPSIIKIEPLAQMTPIATFLNKQKSFLMIDLTCDEASSHFFNNWGLNLDGNLLVERTSLAPEIINAVKYFIKEPDKEPDNSNLRRSKRLQLLPNTKKLNEYIGRGICIDDNVLKSCCAFQNNYKGWMNHSAQQLKLYSNKKNKVWLYLHVSPLSLSSNRYPRYNGIRKIEVDEYITLLKITKQQVINSTQPPVQILIYGGVSENAEDIALSEKCINNADGEPIMGICLFEEFAVLAHVRQNRLLFSSFSSLSGLIQGLMKKLGIKYYFLFDDSRNQVSNIELTLLNTIVGKKPFYTSTLGAIPLQVTNVRAAPFVKRTAEEYVNCSSNPHKANDLLHQMGKIPLKVYYNCLKDKTSFNGAWDKLWSSFGNVNQQNTKTFNTHSLSQFLLLLHQWYKSYRTNPQIGKAILDMQSECLKYFRFSGYTLYSGSLSSNNCSQAVDKTIQEHFILQNSASLKPLLSAIYNAYAPLFLVLLDNNINQTQIMLKAQDIWGGSWRIHQHMQQQQIQSITTTTNNNQSTANLNTSSFSITTNSNNMGIQKQFTNNTTSNKPVPVIHNLNIPNSTQIPVTTNNNTMSNKSVPVIHNLNIPNSTQIPVTTNNNTTSSNPFKDIPKIDIDMSKLQQLSMPQNINTNKKPANPFKNPPKVDIDFSKLPTYPSSFSFNQNNSNSTVPTPDDIEMNSKKKSSSRSTKKKKNKKYMTYVRKKDHDGAFECRLCDKSYNEQWKLNRHMKSHQKAQFKCPHCDMAFRENYKLNRHLKIHNNNRTKSHICHVCGSGFLERDYLNAHMKVHTETESHPCQQCDRKFDSSSKLNRHMVVHTGEKPHQCKYCLKRFNDKYNLKQHLRIHNNDNTHQCIFCHQTFTSSTALKYHLDNNVCFTGTSRNRKK
ncbi:MAG: hypothetical protein GY750_18230 [Lentisphaerae bacterium]|nr:hypothetical protein [Lentisphaerota bacterium]MCP4103335.1 hypothetical protein [Lentisphaerota bacterium]